jgi:hypothetical protein
MVIEIYLDEVSWLFNERKFILNASSPLKLTSLTQLSSVKPFYSRIWTNSNFILFLGLNHKSSSGSNSPHLSKFCFFPSFSQNDMEQIFMFAMASVSTDLDEPPPQGPELGSWVNPLFVTRSHKTSHRTECCSARGFQKPRRVWSSDWHQYAHDEFRNSPYAATSETSSGLQRIPTSSGTARPGPRLPIFDGECAITVGMGNAKM